MVAKVFVERYRILTNAQYIFFVGHQGSKDSLSLYFLSFNCGVGQSKVKKSKQNSLHPRYFDNIFKTLETVSP